ncbi:MULTISPECIES: methionine ABC transporter permease [unclassified Acinetobacter]|uniref:methionine ABC transporter permease n=1 Tax=unclassified Acinetobacter TaxID=196816 RepID=UPI002934A94E|nr:MULTISPECIES: methionine ABC transporter permease [unclassified Acinetobacter]WOE32480.1 methionine ABC transporter permease [Acinetobacter sp. SAAs470]WOE37956.1 methionine ABC transporter permease [Acinetobacter sp. SAAs474]
MSKDIVLSNNTPWSDIPSMLWPAYLETWTMVSIVMVFVIGLGGILGIALFNSSERGLFYNLRIYYLLNMIVNIGRSLPFLVLMAAIIPLTKWLTGTTIGIAAAVVPMTIAGIPFFARLVENALNELPTEIIAVGRVSGGTHIQIIQQVQLKESLPSLVSAATLNLIAMIEYSAIAGTIGAGGIGYLAVLYGYQRFDEHIMIATIITLIVTIQIVQFIGNRISHLLKYA